MTERLLYTVEDAADALRLSRSKVYEEMAAGRLESVKVGRSRRIPRGAIVAYVDRLRTFEGV